MKFEKPNIILGKLGKSLKATLAAGMLFAGGEGLKADADTSIIFGNKSSEVPGLVTIASRNEKVSISEALRQEFIKKTGYDMVAIAEKAGFAARFDVDNGTGPYIVHVGQAHFVKNIEKYPKIVEEIVSTQKKIEQVLLVFIAQSSTSITNVFVEGLNDGNHQKRITEVKKRLSSISPKNQSQGCFLRKWKDWNSWIPATQKIDEGVSTLPFSYLYRQKLQELREYFISHPNEYKPVNDPDAGNFTTPEQEFKFALEKIVDKFDNLGNDSIYIAGATDKLSIEGKINIIRADTDEGLDSALKAGLKSNKAYKLYAIAPSGIEKNRLKEEYLQKEKDYEKKVDHDREDIALQQIEEGNSILKQKIIPLIYGSVHEFKRTILEYNARNIDRKFGLITFIPKKDLNIINNESIESK